MPLSFTKRRFDGSLSAMEVALCGRISLPEAMLLRKSVRRTLQQGYTTLIVNLKNVREVDPTAWDCLLGAALHLHRLGGHIILRHCPDELYDQSVALRKDRFLLIPERRPADADGLPAPLRDWALQALDPEDAPRAIL